MELYNTNITVFCVCLPSLSIMVFTHAKAIYVVMVTVHFIAEYYPIVCMNHMYHISFIRSSADGDLDCLQFWGIRNNAAMTACVPVFLWTYVFTYLGEILRGEISGLYGKFTFRFRRNFQTVFQSSCFFHKQYKRVPVSPHPHLTYYCLSVDNSHSSRQKCQHSIVVKNQMLGQIAWV